MRIIRRETNDSMDLKEMGSRIAAARKEAKLSQEELADNAKISHRALQRLESGANNSTIGTIYSAANALDIRLSELFEGIDNPKKVTKPKGDTFHPAEFSVSILSKLSSLPLPQRRFVLALALRDSGYAKAVSLPDLLETMNQFAKVLHK